MNNMKTTRENSENNQPSSKSILKISASQKLMMGMANPMATVSSKDDYTIEFDSIQPTERYNLDRNQAAMIGPGQVKQHPITSREAKGGDMTSTQGGGQTQNINE